jgi:hypothetical protein
MSENDELKMGGDSIVWPPSSGRAEVKHANVMILKHSVSAIRFLGHQTLFCAIFTRQCHQFTEVNSDSDS